jgi:hypothetical protein
MKRIEVSSSKSKPVKKNPGWVKKVAAVKKMPVKLYV